MSSESKIDWITIILLAIVFAYAMFVDDADAADLMIHGPSAHFDSTHTNYNNLNLGLGVRLENGAVLGAYDNSFDDLSVYAGYDAKLAQWGPVEARVTFYAVTGYTVAVLPEVMAYASVKLSPRVYLSLGASPYATVDEEDEVNGAGVVLHTVLEIREH